MELPPSQTVKVRSLSTSQRDDKVSPRMNTSHSLDALEKTTKQWLEVPVGTWSARQFAQGEYLMDGWLNVASNDDGMQWATRILRRWIQERAAKNPVVMGRTIIELLHQVLHGWRLHGTNDAVAAQAMAGQLLQEMEEACSEDGVKDMHRPGNKAYSMVFQLLAMNAKDPSTLDKAQELLERRLQNGSADLRLWQSCLHAIAKSSPYRPHAAEKAETVLHQMPIPPDEVCFASVLHAWAKSGRPGAAHRAQAILDRMLSPESPVEPNAVCMNTCIDAWAHSGEAGGTQRAEDLLRRMEELSRQPGKGHLQPDAFGYNTVIHAWAKSDDPRAPQHAQDIFEYMQRLSENGNAMLRPDDSSVGAVLVAWSRSREPGAARQAEAFFNRIEEMCGRGKTRVRLSSRQYTSVINAWANSREQDAAEQAERILKRMEHLGHAGRKEMAPGNIAFTATIRAWSKSPNENAPHRALALLRRMQELHDAGNQEVAPNRVTFNTVISACANHGMALQATKLLQEMRNGRQNIEPDTVTYSSVIDAYAKQGKPLQATKLLYEMESLFHDGNDHVKPNVVSYTTAIAAWTGSDHINAGDEAEALLWRMMEQSEAGNVDAKPNALTVAAVMRVWLSGEEAEAPERVEALLQWMKAQYEKGNADIQPILLNFNCVLESWAKSRRIDAVRRVMRLLQDMLEDPSDDFQPDYHSYNMLLLAIRNSADPDKAVRCHEVLQQMIEACKLGNNSMAPNRWSFHLVLGACARSSDDPDVMSRAATVLRETFREFASSGEWQPTSSTYHLLTNACKALGTAVDTDVLDDVRRYCEASSDVKWDVQEPIERKQYFWQRH